MLDYRDFTAQWKLVNKNPKLTGINFLLKVILVKRKKIAC